MSGLEEYADRFRNADRIIMTAVEPLGTVHSLQSICLKNLHVSRLRLNTDQSSDTATLLFVRTMCDRHFSKWRNGRYISCNQNGKRSGSDGLWYL